MVVEAEPRQREFYLRHGLARLATPYRVPRFDGDMGLVEMDMYLYGEELPTEFLAARFPRNSPAFFPLRLWRGR